MPIYKKYILGNKFLWINDHQNDYYSCKDIARYLKWNRTKVNERLLDVNDCDWIEWDELNILISSLTLNENGSALFQYDDYASDLVFLTKEGVLRFVGNRKDDTLTLLMSDVFYIGEITFGTEGQNYTLNMNGVESAIRLLRLNVVVDKNGALYTNAGRLLTEGTCKMIKWKSLCAEETEKDFGSNVWLGYRKTDAILNTNEEPLRKKLSYVLQYAAALFNINLNSITELVDMCKFCERSELMSYAKKIQHINYGIKLCTKHLFTI